MSPHTTARLRMALLLLLAILVQTTFGSDMRVLEVAPDLMIVLVICAGMAGGSRAGAWVGFWAGLLTDLFLTTTPLGLTAFTYCVVGASVGFMRESYLHDRRALLPIAAVAGTAAAVLLFVAAGDVLGQHQLVAGGRSWLIRVMVIESLWSAVLVLPFNWAWSWAAKDSAGVQLLGSATVGDAVPQRQGDLEMSAPEPSPPRVRLTILMVVVGCLFAALLARLWFLQVINAPRAEAVAADNGVRAIYTPAPRGLILDRNGNILAYNVNEPVIEVDRRTAATDPDMQTRLAPLLGMTVKELDSAIANPQYGPYAPVPVKTDANPGQILYMQENQNLFPGVTAASIPVRRYTPLGAACGNILGYVGQIDQTELAKLKNQGYQPGDQIGLAGVEATFESYLRGTPGVTKVQVNSQGQVLTTLSSTPPVPGDNIRLSIDAHVQVAAEGALEQGMNAAHHTFDTVTSRNFAAPAASAVVEDPDNGQIVALATEPTYDPSLFVGGISEANYQALLDNPSDPLLDRTIQGQYAPGSTFKLVTALAGLKYGLITPNTYFDDTGQHPDRQLHRPQRQRRRLRRNQPDPGDHRLQRQLLQHHRTQLVVRAVPVRPDRPPEHGRRSSASANRPASTCPDEAPGKIPTPASYVKDHEARPGGLHPVPVVSGQQRPGRHRPGRGAGHPAPAGQRLRHLRQRRHPLHPPAGRSMRRPRPGKVVKTFQPKTMRTIPIQPAWRARCSPASKAS